MVDFVWCVTMGVKWANTHGKDAMTFGQVLEQFLDTRKSPGIPASKPPSYTVQGGPSD